MIDLKKLFVLVPSTASVTVDALKTESESTGKIYFVEKTNEIIAKGSSFGASASDLARITALETTINGKAAVGTEGEDGYEAAVEGLTSKVSALQTLLGADDSKGNALSRIAALETLVAIGDDDAESTVIDRVVEVLDWFKNLPEEESGAVALVADVAANKAAIGAEVSHLATEEDVTAGKAYQVGDKVIDTPASGLTARVAALEGGDITIAEATEESMEGDVTNEAHVKVAVTTEDGSVTGVVVTTADIASATLVGTLPEDATATTVVGYAEEVAAAVQGETTATVKSLEDEIGVDPDGDAEGSGLKARISALENSDLASAATITCTASDSVDFDDATLAKAEGDSDDNVLTAAAIVPIKAYVDSLHSEVANWDMWENYTPAVTPEPEP